MKGDEFDIHWEKYISKLGVEQATARKIFYYGRCTVTHRAKVAALKREMEAAKRVGVVLTIIKHYNP
jgi:D-alanyl-D-alanine dipeptidase